MDLENKFEEILDEFDFRKVHKMMEKLEWKWSFLEGKYEVPKISEMKKTCRRLFFDSFENFTKYNMSESNASTGGFCVTVYKDEKSNEQVMLQFILEEKYSE